MEQPKYKLVNAYEELVMTNVRELMGKNNACMCERCFLDICAIVMNNGYSRFVTTREGEVLAKVPDMSHGNRVEMMVIIMDAIKTVTTYPNH